MRVIIAGSGPAGLSVAAAIGERADVTVVSPTLSSEWFNSYGVWTDVLRGAGYEDCAAHTWESPIVRADGRVHRIDRAYSKLDGQKLRAQMLQRSGFRSVEDSIVAVRRETGCIVVTTQSGDEHTGDLLLDASGASRKAEAGWRMHQWALGVEATLSAPVAASMLFMDFDGPDTIDGPPSFLYAMPLGGDRWFLEETVLLSSERVSMRSLWRRLRARMASKNIDMRDAQIVERCVIPLDVPASSGGGPVVRFGAAAGMVHPATGYMLGSVLSRADLLAEAMLSGDTEAAREVVWPASALVTDRLYRVAADMVDSLTLSETRQFFAAFFGLPDEVRDGFLDRLLDLRGLRRSMFGVFVRTSPEVRRILLAAGLRRARPLATAVLGL